MKTGTPTAPDTEPTVKPPKGQLGVEALRTPWGTWFWDEKDGMIRYVPHSIRRATVRVRLEPYYRDHPDPMVRLAYAMKFAANEESKRITSRYPHPNAGRRSPLHRLAQDAKAKAIAAGMTNPRRRYGVRKADDPESPITRYDMRKTAWASRGPGEIAVATYDGVFWFEDMPGGGIKR